VVSQTGDLVARQVGDEFQRWRSSLERAQTHR
jgi:hypothetical protein